MTLPSILSRLRLPVIGAPLFIISNPKLVIAQCTAGIVGSFPALNARPAAQLDEWLHEITEALAAHDREHPDRPAAPFAVNQIVHRSNDRFARKAVAKGADGLIAVAAGAGGHAGRWSPFALVQEIRLWFEGPLILSGAIATGSAVLSAQAMGADLAYVGSPFIATPEARCADEYRQAIVAAGAADIVNSALFTGIAGNYLRSSIERSGLDPDSLDKVESLPTEFGSDGSTKSKAWRDIWGSGQGIGVIDKVQPAADYVATLAREYDAALKRLCEARAVR